MGRFQERSGVKPDQLQCGSHFPMNRQAEEALLIQGVEPKAQHNNCSGKHTGFLSAARALGAPLESYLKRDHPVQRVISAQICRLSGEP
ncbi:MAG: asparaginase, partial [Candidatus Neomarinimicrobiota bacterium]